MSAFLGVPVGAAYHLVFALTQLLTPVAGGLAAAAAIVLFTAAVRLAISPLSLRALRGQAAMARLAPQVQALRARFGRQPERFSSELAALYKREGASPFAGFLPLLAQWPILSVMYLLFRSGHRGRRTEPAAVRWPVRRPARRALAVRRQPAQRARRALPRRLRGPRRPVLAVGPPGAADRPRRTAAAPPAAPAARRATQDRRAPHGRGSPAAGRDRLREASGRAQQERPPLARTRPKRWPAARRRPGSPGSSRT